MSKQEIISKLANNEDLTEEEIEFMVEEFKEVHRELTEVIRSHICVTSVFEVGDNLYYEVPWLESYTDADNQFDEQPYRVEKATKPVEVFVRCKN